LASFLKNIDITEETIIYSIAILALVTISLFVAHRNKLHIKNKSFNIYSLLALIGISLVGSMIINQSGLNKNTEQQIDDLENHLSKADDNYFQKQNEVTQEIQNTKNSYDYTQEVLGIKSKYIDTLSYKLFEFNKNASEKINALDLYNKLYDKHKNNFESNNYEPITKNILNSVTDYDYHVYSGLANWLRRIRDHRANLHFKSTDDKLIYDEEEDYFSEVEDNDKDYIEESALENFLFDNIYQIKTNNEKIKQIWGFIKPVVFKKIKKKHLSYIPGYYESKNNPFLFLDYVIKVHDYLYTKPNVESYFENYNYELDTQLESNGDYIFEVFNDLDDDLKKEFSFMALTADEHTGFYWAFGFWDRRYNDGTTETIYDILVEINNYYKN